MMVWCQCTLKPIFAEIQIIHRLISNLILYGQQAFSFFKFKSHFLYQRPSFTIIPVVKLPRISEVVELV